MTRKLMVAWGWILLGFVAFNVGLYLIHPGLVYVSGGACMILGGIADQMKEDD